MTTPTKIRKLLTDALPQLRTDVIDDLTRDLVAVATDAALDAVDAVVRHHRLPGLGPGDVLNVAAGINTEDSRTGAQADTRTG